MKTVVVWKSVWATFYGHAACSSSRKQPESIMFNRTKNRYGRNGGGTRAAIKQAHAQHIIRLSVPVHFASSSCVRTFVRLCVCVHNSG